MITNQELLDYAGGDELFAEWLRKVTQLVEAVSGLSIFDLPDQPYGVWYETETSPARAARAALLASGYPGTFLFDEVT